MRDDDGRLQLPLQHLAPGADTEDGRLVPQVGFEEEAFGLCLLGPQQVLPARSLLVLQLGQPACVRLEVGEDDLAHSVHVLVTHLPSNLPVHALQEPEIELEPQHRVLRDLVVGQRLLELVDLEEEVLPDLRHRLDLQLLQDILDVRGGAGLPEALLLQEGDLVVQNLELLEEELLADRCLEDGGDELFGDDEVVDELAELAADALPVPEAEVHLDALLLKVEDLTADAAQVGLEAEQQPLHPGQDRVAA